MNNSTKLTADEARALLKLVREYSTIEQDLLNYENRIEEIDAEKSEIKNKLNLLNDRILQLRGEEQDLTNQLVNKYGQFVLDPETLEIHSTK